MIRCAHCQTENRPAAIFCLRCGWVLGADCPRCGGDLLNGADYCDHCGLALNPQAGFQWGGNIGRIDRSTKSPAPGELTARPTSPAAQAGELTARPTETPFRSSRPTSNVQSPSSDDSLRRYASRELLDKLEAARQAGEMVGERRVVTMLFCDVKGSTAAAEKLDPEEWGEIMNGAFEYMISPVYAYEGLVARLQGDSILAFFGAPITHEDDPQRAVLAGLEIVNSISGYRAEVQRKYGIEFDVRVGINTGMVVVGAVGSDLKMEYTALGDAINLAARMEQTALPGTVQIAQDTYKLVKGMFEVEELGEIEVKGKSEPVRAYRVLSRISLGLRQRGIEGLHAEMVGREAELHSLLAILNDLRQGVGWLACILGEAGLGKSRLIKEARQAIEQDGGAELEWFETGSLSYEANQAYALFLRLIQQTCEFGFDEPEPQVRENINNLVETLPEFQRSAARHVFELLFGVSSENGRQVLEGESFKQELLETIQSWWRSRFAGRPAVLVFDDMHWADAASIELLKQLLSLVEELPLVMIFSLRPERDAPAWTLKTTLDGDFRHRLSELALRPLSDAETNELVNRLLAIAELPDSLRAGILERSGGNPFFVEEVVRSLIENGVVKPEDRTSDGVTRRYWTAASQQQGFEIPDNLQTLLTTRMDRLEEGTRGTLQIASVIGRSFYRRVLQAVDEAERDLDKRLGTLMRVDMIREAARLPELEYSFRNPLTQEAVYNTILIKRRKEFHRRVGEALESLYPDRAEAMYGLLAHHFSLAGQAEKAAGYYRRLAGQAMEVFAFEEAANNLRQALNLIENDPPDESHLALWEELGDAFRLLRDGAGAVQAYRRALALQGQMLAELTGAGEARLEVRSQLVTLRLNRKIVQVVADLKWTVDLETFLTAAEHAAAARRELEAGLAALSAGPPHPETARAQVALAIEAWRLQDPPDWQVAESYAQGAVDTANRLEDPTELSQALGALATVLDGGGRLREHLAVAHRRIDLVQSLPAADLREQTEAGRLLGAALMYVGDYASAMPVLEEAAARAERIRAVDEQANSLALQVQCLLRLDRWDEVLALEPQWRELDRRYTRERVGET